MTAYRGVSLEGLAADVDLEVSGEDGQLIFRATHRSGKHLEGLALGLLGADDLHQRDDGGVVVATEMGSIGWGPPRVIGPRGEVALEGGWSWQAADGFLVARRRPGTPPLGASTLEWSTYFGGSSSEGFRDVAVHGDGSISAAGFSLSGDLPTSEGAFQIGVGSNPAWSGFVARFSADGGSLLHATYLGGSVRDEVFALAPGPGGNLVIGGSTLSPDFPVTPGAFDTTKEHIATDGFVSVLNADGSQLIASTFFGGQPLDGEPLSDIGTDTVQRVAVDSEGNIVIAGITKDPLLPVTAGAVQSQLADVPNSQDGFIAKLSGDLTELHGATYLGGGTTEAVGGSGTEWLNGLALMPDDSIVVVGETNSPVFPVTPDAYAPAHHGGVSKTDGFVARLSPDLSTLIFGTYLGGEGRDQPRDVAIHPDGSIVVVGEVESKITFGEDYDFPVTPDAWDPIGNGGADGFLCYFDPLGTELRYSTLFGGSGREELPMALAIDSAGSVTVACGTFSFDAPVTPGALQLNKLTPQNNQTGYLARFRPNHQLLYGTYLGGTGIEITLGLTSIGLELNPLGDVFIAQGTTSTDFPLTAHGAFPEHAGGVDGFLTKLTMLPAGVTRYGDSTPGPQGPLAVSVLGMPNLGSDGFGWSCTSAPPDADGWLLLSGAPLASPVALGGAELWVDPARLLSVARARSDEFGYFERRVPLPAAPELAGLEVFAQFVWPTPGAQAASTAALRVELQR